ncbi:hypothetical protein [Luteimonas panaciterrae]|uniref:hypothetical protein n=1 Tax=Luteimonas panaciterrae TaxID=363885 RepID=UPI001CFAE30B|nr:hypothetical protein [Luteimonas panaciterrae]
MNSSFPQTTLQALQPDDADYAAILDVARIPAEQVLTLPISLHVDSLDRYGAWAFLLAQLRAPDGRRLDFSRTPLAEQAAAGGLSDVYAALLKQEGAQWRIVAHVVGPGDVAWESWPQDHGAPAALFGQ